MDGKIKAPTIVGRMWLVGLRISAHRHIGLAGVFASKINDFNGPIAITVI